MFVHFSLKIAIKWIIKAFSGCLATDQILQLWDCILAYDTTEIIVGMFKNLILYCTLMPKF